MEGGGRLCSPELHHHKRHDRSDQHRPQIVYIQRHDQCGLRVAGDVKNFVDGGVGRRGDRV